MNRSYRTVWNHALGAWVAISELGRRRGRGGVRAGVATALLAGAVMGAQAQARYWDRNDDNAGAGTQLDGVWDSSSTNWNRDQSGSGPIGLWQPNNVAVFAAGSNSDSSYQVQVDPGGITGVNGMTFLNTSPVSIVGGPIALTGPGLISMTPNTFGAVTYSIGSAVTGVDMQVQGSSGQVSTLALNNSLNLSGSLAVERQAVLRFDAAATIGTGISVDDADLIARATLVTPAFRVQNGGSVSIAGFDAVADVGVLEVAGGTFAVSDGARMNASTITIDATSRDSLLTLRGIGSTVESQGPVKVIGGAVLGIRDQATLRAPSVALGADSDTAGGILVMQGGGVLETGGLSVGDTLRLPGTTVTASLRNAEIRATRSNPEFFARFQDGELALDAGVTAIHSNGFDIGTASGFAGFGGLNKIGTGTFTLGGTSTYTGPTTISEGTLIAGNANSLAPQSAHAVGPGAMLDLAGRSQAVGALSNGGMVSLVGTVPGTTLTVRGAYVGLGGSTLRLGTALGDSTSVSDRLVIDGGTVSGQSRIAIVNIGGLGAQTTGNGIEVVGAINGGTTTAQTTRDGFVLAGGHVDAGAYEYTLHPADAGTGEGWYLRSAVAAAPAQPPTAGPAPAPGQAATTSGLPTYRREVPLFAALPSQLHQAGQQMLGDLHKRIGDDQAADPGNRRAWGRVIAGDSETRQAGTVNPASEGRYVGFQAGTDLWADGGWHLGVYAGQLDSDPQVSGVASGVWGPVGHNDLRSQYVAGYGTWRNAQGWYTDLVVQGGRHRISVEPQSTLHWNTKASSLAASVEVGKAIAVGDGGWTLEPQLQLVRQRVNVDDTVISGARVQTDGGEGWLARAGLRVKGELTTAAGSLQPYGRVNVYRISGDATRARFIGPAATTDILTSVDSTLAETAAGFTLAMTPALSLYGEVGKVFDVGGSERQESTLRGTLGLKARW